MIRQRRVPRKAKHSPDELRELIISAATTLIERDGLEGVSAREIARQINYSPGTLYNVFKDRDEILLTIESRMLDELAEHLDRTGGTKDPRSNVLKMAQSYLKFTQDNANRWNMLFEHRLPAGQDAPVWYQEKIVGLLARVETVLEPMLPDAKRAEVQRSARVLWAGVHGVASLSTMGKLANVTKESAAQLIDNLVGTYLDGLSARGCGPRAPAKTRARARKS